MPSMGYVTTELLEAHLNSQKSGCCCEPVIGFSLGSLKGNATILWRSDSAGTADA